MNGHSVNMCRKDDFMALKQNRYEHLPVRWYAAYRVMRSMVFSCGYVGAYGSCQQPVQ